MLTRLAATLLAFSLAVPAVSAEGFARRPIDTITVAKEPTRAEVGKALAQRRTKNLASFRSYWKGGVYPHNTWRVGPLNVWRDEAGHLCAAATMIDKDGKHELVQKTAQDSDFIRLLDVTSGPLLDWIMTSGFTIEEIDRIQAPMVQPDIETPEQRQLADARLRAGYVQTDKFLVRSAKKDLELATDRLMKNPELAAKLVAGLV